MAEKMGGGSSGSSYGMLFFIIAVVIAASIFLFAHQSSYSPSVDQNAAVTGWNFVAPDLNGFGQQGSPAGGVEVFFCPQDACAEHLIQRIDSAHQSIYIAIYSFTHDGIADAVIRAKERGVDVRIVFDYDQSNITSSDDKKIQAAGVMVARRNGPGYMHNKFAVIDGNVVATGSFNYSANADEKNDENLVFIQSAEVATKFKQDFDHLWSVSDAA